MCTEITSASNKTYKHIKSLNIRSKREKHNEYIIEGVRLVNDALETMIPIKLIVLSESFLNNTCDSKMLEKITKSNIDIYKMTDQLFKDISNTETPQGIIGLIPISEQSINDMNIKENGFFVFCDNVQDPGNLGTIIRTADAAGADGVILSKGCVDVYNPKTIRSTMGAIFHLPIIKTHDTKEMLLYLKQKGLEVISGYLGASKYHFDVNMENGIVIVIGNEANGIAPEVISLSDYLVKIPIPGRAESLNAGIASGILMYEAVRQRIK